VLVTWTVRTTKAAAELRLCDSFARGLIEKLNHAHAAASPSVFTCGLEIESAVAGGAEVATESFLGQYLLAIERAEAESLPPADAALMAELPAGLAQRLDARRVLQRAARLGRELLTAEEPGP
jgi:hypothetical protein